MWVFQNLLLSIFPTFKKEVKVQQEKIIEPLFGKKKRQDVGKILKRIKRNIGGEERGN
jgi:hypothetical protein